MAAEAARATKGNLANFADASTLSSKTNTFNQSEASRLLESAMPGFGALRGKLMESVNADLAGEDTLSKTQQQQIAQFAAEKGVTRGTSGQFNGFNLVRDFGFNLTDWKQASRARALNTLSTVFNMAPRVNIMSPQSAMVDANTAVNVAGGNNRMAFDSAQAGYNADAAASNANASLMGGLITSVGGVAGAAVQQYNAKPKTTVNASKPPAALAKTGPAYGSSLPRFGNS